MLLRILLTWILADPRLSFQDNDDFVEATDEQSTQPSTAHDQTTGKDSTDPTPTPYDTSKELLNGHQDPSQPSVRDALPSSGASDNVDDSEGPSHASQPDSSAPNTNHEAHGSRDSTAPFPQLDGASGPSDHKNAEGPSSGESKRVSAVVCLLPW